MEYSLEICLACGAVGPMDSLEDSPRGDTCPIDACGKILWSCTLRNTSCSTSSRKYFEECRTRGFCHKHRSGTCPHEGNPQDCPWDPLRRKLGRSPGNTPSGRRFDGHANAAKGRTPSPRVKASAKQQKLASKDGRTPLCKFFKTKNKCYYGDKCGFSHNTGYAHSAVQIESVVVDEEGKTWKWVSDGTDEGGEWVPE